MKNGLAAAGTRDLDSLLEQAGDQVSWNAGAKADGMLPLAPLVYEMVKICTNGVVPAKRLETAIRSQDELQRINFSKDKIEVYSNTRGTLMLSIANNMHVQLTYLHAHVLYISHTCVVPSMCCI